MSNNKGVLPALDDLAIAMSIRLMVKAVILSDEPVYRIHTTSDGLRQVDPTKLECHFRNPWAWERHYMRGLGGDDCLDAFYAACRDIGIDFGLFGVVSYDEDLDCYFATEETFNRLALSIRRHLCPSVFLPAVDLTRLSHMLVSSIPVIGSILGVALFALAEASRAPAAH